MMIRVYKNRSNSNMKKTEEEERYEEEEEAPSTTSTVETYRLPPQSVQLSTVKYSKVQLVM